MTFQTPITIKEACDNMQQTRYILPDIQREFVWSANKIERLFDSLMRGYPIGSFLFWKLDGKAKTNFRFYDFIRDYHAKDRKHNPIASTKETDNDLTAILDGQQRLTALYIGLRGSYAYKKKFLAENHPKAYPQRFLYLDIVNTIEKESAEEDKGDFLYNFKFLEETEGKDKRLFKVGEVLNFEKLSDVSNYLRKIKLEESTILENFFDIITKGKIINFYEDIHSDIDQVLDIFVRTNMGGEPLSKSDLLLSTVTARWKDDVAGKSARDQVTEFVDEINKVREGFNFTKDFVLKSCLMLTDLNVEFLAKNLTKNNIDYISDSWEKIKESMKATVDLIAGDFGYDGKELTSINVVIPVAYYFMKRNNSNALTIESKQAIKKWIIISLVKGLFGGSGDTILTKARKIIDDAIKKNPNVFPWHDLKKGFTGRSRTLSVSDEDIEHILDNKRMVFSTLALLYPDFDLTQHFQVDHVFPKDFFRPSNLNVKIKEEYHKKYTDQKDRVANLQFLSASENMKKSNMEPLKWLQKICKSDENKIKEWKEKNYVGDLSLGIGNFESFYSERRKKIKEKLMEILKD